MFRMDNDEDLTSVHVGCTVGSGVGSFFPYVGAKVIGSVVGSDAGVVSAVGVPPAPGTAAGCSVGVFYTFNIIRKREKTMD